MEDGAALASAAAAYVGAPFRLHGRSRAGLDCVGLLGCALADCGRQVPLPQGYGLRNRDPARLFACFVPAGFVRQEDGASIDPGDVLVVIPGPAQQHLLIATGEDRFVHAHAGLRRVVEMAAPVPWPVLQHWRLDSSQ